MCLTCGCGDYHHHTNHHHHHEHDVQQLETDILAVNNQYAENNQKYFQTNSILSLNFLSSPGSGKTSLLEYTIKALKKQEEFAVIEGDQHTDLDSQRIKEAGAHSYQINTGKACHLDAHMVSHAITDMTLNPDSILFIENVGNLICPGLFNLGEQAKVVLFSVTEGADKPLKYPDIFFNADLVVITKCDLLPYLDTSLEECINSVHKIKANVPIISLSIKSGEGVTKWFDWLKEQKEQLECINTKDCK